jgi:DNA-binding GntR family transcriptional regulator
MSLTGKAYELIRDEIITCTLPPGQQIAQAQVAERLGMGLTPVREALQRLAEQGFVRVIPRFGYIVSPVTLSDVAEIFELRGILEAVAARLACERATDAQIAGLADSAQFTYVYHDRQSYSEFLARNFEFHRSVAVAAGNQRLADSIARTLAELTRVFHLGLDLRDSAAEMRDEHIALTQALEARDADRAEAIVRSQISRSQQRVAEALMGSAGGVSGRAMGDIQVK